MTKKNVCLGWGIQGQTHFWSFFRFFGPLRLKIGLFSLGRENGEFCWRKIPHFPIRSPIFCETQKSALIFGSKNRQNFRFWRFLDSVWPKFFKNLKNFGKWENFFEIFKTWKTYGFSSDFGKIGKFWLNKFSQNFANFGQNLPLGYHFCAFGAKMKKCASCALKVLNLRIGRRSGKFWRLKSAKISLKIGNFGPKIGPKFQGHLQNLRFCRCLLEKLGKFCEKFRKIFDFLFLAPKEPKIDSIWAIGNFLRKFRKFWPTSWPKLALHWEIGRKSAQFHNPFWAQNEV